LINSALREQRASDGAGSEAEIERGHDEILIAIAIPQEPDFTRDVDTGRGHQCETERQ
jgi:hypothetical protein